MADATTGLDVLDPEMLKTLVIGSNVEAAVTTITTTAYTVDEQTQTETTTETTTTEPVVDEALLLFACRYVEQAVKNFCHLKKYPKKLEFIGYEMALDFFRNGGLGADGTNLSVTSVTEGDATVKYGNVVPEQFMEGFLKDYTAQLVAFRKVNWNGLSEY